MCRRKFKIWKKAENSQKRRNFKTYLCLSFCSVLIMVGCSCVRQNVKVNIEFKISFESNWYELLPLLPNQRSF